MMHLDDLMYQVSGFFLTPVLLLLVILFAYACFVLGSFIMQSWQRRYHSVNYTKTLENFSNRVDSDSSFNPLRGYPLLNLAIHNPEVNKDDLDIAAMHELEGVRAVSRLAPMLGLIATMIPMGPALKSLSDGNVQGISENLIVAFSAVVFGLVIASITFWIASFKKRWLAAELVDVNNVLEIMRTSQKKSQEKA